MTSHGTGDTIQSPSKMSKRSESSGISTKSTRMCAWIIGAGSQATVFFGFNAVDFYNFYYTCPPAMAPENGVHPMPYIGLALGVGAATGALVARTAKLSSEPAAAQMRMVVALLVSAVLTVFGFMVTAAGQGYTTYDASTVTMLSLTAVLLAGGAACQSVAGDAFYGLAGSFMSETETQRAQAGGVTGFAASFVVRAVTKAAVSANAASASEGEPCPAGDARASFLISGLAYTGCLLALLLAAAWSAWKVGNVVRKHAGARTVPTTEALMEVDLDLDLEESAPAGEVDLLQGWPAMQAAARAHWCPLLIVFGSLVIANSVFPGLASTFHGGDASWFIVVAFGSYSVGDWLGKSLPAFGVGIGRARSSAAVKLARTLGVQLVLAVPLIMIATWDSNTAVQSDEFAYVFLLLFGVNTGLCICAAMMALHEKAGASAADGSDHAQPLLSAAADSPRYGPDVPSAVGFCVLQAGVLVGMGSGVLLSELI